MIHSNAERFAAKYFVETELYNRSLPGSWRPKDPEVWLPRPDVLGASLRFAAHARRTIRRDAMSAGVDPHDFDTARRRINQQGWRFAYLQKLASELAP